MIIIGLIVTGVVAGKNLVDVAKLAGARAITNTSVILSTEGLVLWLDATSNNSILESESINNTLVSTWTDVNPKLITKYNATATGGNEPLYVINAINNLPALEFDGTTNDLMTFTTDDMFDAPNTIFIVAQFIDNANPGTQSILSRRNGSESGGIMIRMDASSVRNYCFDNSGFINTSRSKPNNGNSFIITTNTDFADGGKCRIALNGESLVESSGSLSGFTNNGNSLTPEIGAQSGGSNFNGYIGEIIIFNKILPASDIDLVEEYLSAKWGIDLS